MSEAALQAKNKGNEAFSKGNFQEAIKHFTEAIKLDPTNHVLYSNRSASFASLQQYKEALVDADKTIDLKPDWSKGYSRKGAALFGLGKLDEAAHAYTQGLQLEPNNQQLRDGLADVQKTKKQSEQSKPKNDPMSMIPDLFRGDFWSKIRDHPVTAPLLLQPDFLKLLSEIHKRPESVTEHLNDQRVMAVVAVLMGIPVQTSPTPMEEDEEPPKPKQEPKKEEKKVEPVIELTEEQKKAEEEKNLGNEAYKKKDFETAIKHYNAAMEFDPKNIVYLTNRAAVYAEIERYEDAIADCNKAIDEGRKQFADYKLIAKAYQRIGNIHMKKKQYVEAVEAYNKSLTEDRTGQTLELLKKAEKLKKEQEALDYLSPQLSLEAKERGNKLFQTSDFPGALKEYNEAIKRNPKDHVLYSNRAACYMKLAEYRLGLADCEECIKMKPDFVKAYVRKGHIHYFLKEYQRALETYDQGLKLDPNNQELEESVTRTLAAMQQTDPTKLREEALKDPEIQEILSDPVMRQMLQDMSSDPKAAQEHMKNPVVAAKIQKLVNAGVLRVM